MAETNTPVSATHSNSAGARAARRTYYDCGGGRKTFFSVAFIVLLPFFISLPVMLFQRITKGVWLDTWGLIVIAVLFCALMLLIFFELMFSLRAYVELGPESVSFTLPSRGGGVIPMFFYQSRTIPYVEIEQVETRREVYGNTIAPMMMRTVRLVLRTGERITLGYANEADDDPRFPFPLIGRQIAECAGVPYLDKGNVLRRLHRKMFGLPQSERESEEAEIVALNRKHSRFLILLTVVLVVLLVAGIAIDLWRESADSGERGRTIKIERVGATGTVPRSGNPLTR